MMKIMMMMMKMMMMMMKVKMIKYYIKCYTQEIITNKVVFVIKGLIYSKVVGVLR